MGVKFIIDRKKEFEKGNWYSVIIKLYILNIKFIHSFVIYLYSLVKTKYILIKLIWNIARLSTNEKKNQNE